MDGGFYNHHAKPVLCNELTESLVATYSGDTETDVCLPIHIYVGS